MQELADTSNLRKECNMRPIAKFFLIAGSLAAAIAFVVQLGEPTATAQRRLNPTLAAVMTDDVARNDCIIRTPPGLGATKAAQVCDVATALTRTTLPEN